MRRLLLLAGAAALAFSVNTVLAQDAGKTKAKPPAARTTASLECSKQADAKGLHGKQRRAFRSRCKKDFGKTAKSKA